MKPIQVLIRPVMALLAVFTLTTAVVAHVTHGTTQVQIAGDDPKIPTGG